MKKELIEFLDSIREYMRESGNNIANDERHSSEFVDIFLESKKAKESSQLDVQVDFSDSQSLWGFYKGFTH